MADDRSPCEHHRGGTAVGATGTLSAAARSRMSAMGRNQTLSWWVNERPFTGAGQKPGIDRIGRIADWRQMAESRLTAFGYSNRVSGRSSSVARNDRKLRLWMLAGALGKHNYQDQDGSC